MLSLMKQTAHAPVNEDNRPSELGEITFGVPDVDRLDQADGILRRNAPISAADEEILFKTMELCAAVGERGERRRSDESRSLEDIDDLRRNIIARLVEQNVPLVHAMRKRYSMVGMDPDEMLSEGC